VGWQGGAVEGAGGLHGSSGGGRSVGLGFIGRIGKARVCSDTKRIDDVWETPRYGAITRSHYIGVQAWPPRYTYTNSIGMT
jgi:hypothetical protein